MPEELPGTLPLVAVAGEVIVDLVPADVDGLFRAVPGGSPANVAVGLHRLGVPTRLVARLAGDPMGRRLRRHLETNGLNLGHVVAAAEPTSLAIVSVEDDGTVGYDFRVDGTADWQWTDDELTDVVDDDVVALHVGSLAMALEPGASALRRLVQRARAQVTISYDPNVRPLLVGRREDVVTRVEALVALSDVVKASAEDLAWLYPGDPPATVASRLLGLGPSLVAITLGPAGVLAVGAATPLVQRPAVPVAVVDTVGAGDAFMAALLAGLSQRGLLGRAQAGRLGELAGAELAAVLDDAALAAALTCARPGADPPSAEQLRQARQVAAG
jgi:fructokinase